MNELLNVPAMRSFAWRIGRRLYSWARREAVGGFESSGEHWLLKNVLAHQEAGQPSVLVDIGTYKGWWTESAVSLLRHHKLSGHIHAFEPTAATFSYLSEKFKGNELVSINKIALSDRSGEREFFVIGELGGTNSLLWNGDGVIESVQTLCFDDFLNREGIDHVLFVKSDAEGHDLSVLLGAVEALQNGVVEIWQFEYNHRWIAGRAYLKDVFDFIVDKPYLLGKLYGYGVEVFEKWHPELERFFEANYVLIRKGSPIERLCSRVTFNDRNVLSRN